MSGRLIRRAPVGKRRGFTLVELLVVIGIISVLISILVPVLSSARDQANRTKCLSNLRTIGQAMVLYADTFRDRLPNSNPPRTANDYNAVNAVLVAFARDYVQSPAVFHCPSDSDPAPQQIVTADYLLPDSARVSYDFYSVFWMPEYGPKLARVNRAPLAWDIDGADPNPQSRTRNHGRKGGNVVFADGHAAWQNAGDWDGTNWPNPAAQFYQP